MNNKFWNFKASDKSSAELFLYGEISDSTWWGDEVTPKQFKADLDALGDVSEMKIYINSGGGDVFAGQAIHSMLKRHAAKKTIYIDGLAASIASVIAMAGDKVIMPSNAMMMIHDAWTFVAGSASKLRKMADDMDKIDESIISAYVGKTGKESGEIQDMMHAETWMTARDALEMGFADEIEEEKKLAASIDDGFFNLNGQRFDLGRYRNMPPIAIKTETIKAASFSDEKPVVIDGIKSIDVVDQQTTNDSRDESRPVSDTQKSRFTNIRKKIINAYEEGN